jgi:predicted transcriptional regulator
MAEEPATGAPAGWAKDGKPAIRTLTLRLSEAAHDQLREMAFVARRSQHELLLEALDDFFVKNGKPAIAQPS